MYVPAVVGVPVIVPVEDLRVSPAGRVPDDIDHVMCEVTKLPASASRVAVYAVPFVPFGRLSVVITGFFTEIVTVNCFSAVAEPYTAFTVNVYVPVLVGVPEIVPEVLNVSPSGRFPDDTDQAAPVVLDVRVAEYVVRKMPEGRLVVVIVIVGVGLTVNESCFSAPV